MLEKILLILMELGNPKTLLICNMLQSKISINTEILNFFKEYVGEPILNPFLTYTDLKAFYPLPFLDLRLQINQLNLKKRHVFGDCKVDPANAT